MLEKKIYNTLLDLVKIPSITGSKDEKRMAEQIHNILRRQCYFQHNPHHLVLYPIENHDLFTVLALWKNPKETSKTVILLSHYDVVSVDEYGHLKEYAFDPRLYTEKIKNELLPEDARKDLDSGEWIFGRGIMDMKCGLAIHIELLDYYASRPDLLDCNLLLLSVADEEGNSKGMLGSASAVLSLSQQYHLDYHLVINTEPFFPLYTGDEKKYIFTGSIGKLLPIFYCAGKETHVGEPFSGLNPNLIVSELHKKLEANPEFCEKWDNFVAPPPTCLKQKDLKDAYSVQIPRGAVAYYNWMLLKDGPGEVMAILKKICHETASEILAERKNRLNTFRELSGYPIEPLDWKIDILTYDEVYQKVLSLHGEAFSIPLNEKISSWMAAGIHDERELTIKIVDFTYDYYPEKTPMIIILFAPPFYPSTFNDASSAKDLRSLELVEHLIQYANELHGTALYHCPFFPGLSDNSYFGISHCSEIISSLKPNMPLWGRFYQLPLEELERIKTPVVNIGVFGKDAHKYTERLHLPFSLNTTPSLIMYCLEQI
ncbi:MAG: M20/M25/M40 family metallo-hydrolase [Bacillota bacterium]